MLVPSRARELIEAGAKQALSDLKAVQSPRPRQAVRGQGRVQEHDRSEADALPARRRVPRRPHDQCPGPTTGGRPGSSSSSSTASASRPRSPSCRASSGPPSPRARRRPASARAARPATAGPSAGQRCSGVRLSIATTPPGATSSSAPLALGAHLGGWAALPAPAVEEQEVERRLRGQHLVPVAVENAHVRRVREQAGARSRAIVVDLDRDERRLGRHPGDDPGRADTRSRPDLGELAVRAGCGERTEEAPDLANRRALEAPAPPRALQRGERARGPRPRTA